MPVKERPILMAGSMVRATLDGRKGQTRRVVTPQPPSGNFTVGHDAHTVIDRNGDAHPGKDFFGIVHSDGEWSRVCPYGEPGDRLWVRETFCSGDMGPVRPGCPIAYRADHECTPGPWTPSIHMPRWASRITLAVTSVRVERVQSISEEDAQAEGIWFDDDLAMLAVHGHRFAFQRLWHRINGKRPGCSWDANPWVWVIGFEVVR